MLALVAPAFNQVSETFIADHARTLAPGRTVLVCNDSRGTQGFGCPVLSHMTPGFTAFGRLDDPAKRLLWRLRRRFGRGLSFDDQMRVLEFFRVQGVTAVLGEFGYSGAMMTDVCRRMNLPLYVYFRGNDASSVIRHASVRRRYRRMFATAQGVFCVSQHLADRVVALGCPKNLIHINPSGVLLDVFPPGDPEPGRLIAVGRLVDKKAPHLTIEAFSRIADRFPNAHLDIVGDGPLASRCKEIIARDGLQKRVTLHGELSHDQVGALMRRAAIFVQHSVTAPNGDIEGFPTAIAEAMATALPVVATRHAGIPEHVVDGETGLLVGEGDVGGMATALARLLADSALARRLGAAAHAYAEAHLDRVRARERVRKVIGLDAAMSAVANDGLGCRSTCRS